MRCARVAVLHVVLLGCVGAASSAAAQPACAPDLQLTEAAAELLLARTERPSPQALTSAVRAAGSDAVGVHALFVPAQSPPDIEAKWLATLRERVDGDLSCGRADNEAGRLLIGTGRGAELAPIDPSARIVRGKLRAGFRNGELVIAAADGQLVRVGVTADDLRAGIALAPELAAPLKVQLVARGPTGPRPVAEREIPASTEANAVESSAETNASIEHAAWSGAFERDPERESKSTSAHAEASDAPQRSENPPGAARGGEPARRSGAPQRGGDVAQNAVGAGAAPSGEAVRLGGMKELSARVLELRAARGRGGLRANRLLREAADQHARDVCAKGRVAHVVDSGSGPDERLARAGLDARLLGEAIARADGTESALTALQNSPSHLYTLLDPRFTDFGIGVAQDSAQKYCYVVLLCAWPRYVGKRKP